jgi:hypothetical protein
MAMVMVMVAPLGRSIESVARWDRDGTMALPSRNRDGMTTSPIVIYETKCQARAKAKGANQHPH